jgi:hypothetical protein
MSCWRARRLARVSRRKKQDRAAIADTERPDEHGRSVRDSSYPSRAAQAARCVRKLAAQLTGSRRSAMTA